MRLWQAVQALVVLVAVFIGAPDLAFAHAGHAHQSYLQTNTTAPTASAALGSQQSKQVSQVQRVDRDLKTAAADAVQNVSSDSSIPCMPGVCCCQGASHCGTGGHCCASMPQMGAWFPDFSDHMRFHLARLGWTYPELLFGLDRPPKA